jgi:hypothetical protein
MILARCLTSEAAPERAFALYQRTRGPRARAATEQAAKRGDRYLGEPNAESLKGNEPGAEYAYDAVSTPLGGGWARRLRRSSATMIARLQTPSYRSFMGEITPRRKVPHQAPCMFGDGWVLRYASTVRGSGRLASAMFNKGT